MRVQQTGGSAGGRQFAAVLDDGDRVIASIATVASRLGIRGATLSGIGMINDAGIALYDPGARSYASRDVREQMEVVSLMGNVGLRNDGTPIVHAHIALGRRDLTIIGGHLIEALVHPTMEIFLQEIGAPIMRSLDEACGLQLIRLPVSAV